MPKRKRSSRRTRKRTRRISMSSNSGSNSTISNTSRSITNTSRSNTNTSSSNTNTSRSKPSQKKKKISKSSAAKKIASKIKVVEGSIIQLDPNFPQSRYQVVDTLEEDEPNYLCSPIYKLKSNPNIKKQDLLQMATTFPKAYINQVINKPWQSKDIKKHNLSLLE